MFPGGQNSLVVYPITEVNEKSKMSMSLKKRLRICNRFKKTKETLQLNATHDTGLDPVKEKSCSINTIDNLDYVLQIKILCQ